MRQFRLIALPFLLGGVLASCGSSPAQSPQVTVAVDLSNLAAPTLDVTPKSSNVSVEYAVNGGTKQVWQGISGSSPALPNVCPGSNSLQYVVKWDGQLLKDQQSIGFDYPIVDAFQVSGAPQTLALTNGQTLELKLPVKMRDGLGCVPTVSASVDDQPVQATLNSGPTPSVDIQSAGLTTGAHALKVNVKAGAASQDIAVAIQVTPSDGGGAPPSPGSVTGVTAQPKELGLKVGVTGKVTAVVAGEGKFDPAVVFSSGNIKVATVDDQGVVTAVAAGQTVITATSKADPKQSAVVTATVTAPVQGTFTTSLSPAKVTVSPGGSATTGMGIVTGGGYSGQVNLNVGDVPASSGLSLKTDRTVINANVSGVLTVYAASSSPSGTYTVPVTATDGAQTSTAQLTIVVASPVTPPPGDGQKPQITNVSVSGATLTATPAAVTVAVQDNVAVASVSLSVDGATPKLLTAQGNTYTGSLDLSGLQNGGHGYAVAATDTSGNTATATGTFTVQLPGRGAGILQAVSLGSSAPGTAPMVEGSGTILIGSGWQVLRIDPNSGAITGRSARLDGSVMAIAEVGGTLYAATAAPALWTLDQATLSGEVKVGKLPGNPSNFSQSALGLFLGTGRGVVTVTGASMQAISQAEASGIVAGPDVIYVSSSANSQITKLSATGLAVGTPLSARVAWMTMNTAGSGLNVATASAWNVSLLDLAAWTLTPKATLRATAAGLIEYNNQMFVLDNVGNLLAPSGTSQMIEKAANASFGPALVGSTLYAATDSGNLYAYGLTATDAVYLNKTSNLGKLGAPMVVDARGRIYYPNAAGTLYILQGGN